MTNLQIFNKPKSDKKYKLGKAICAAGIVMALLPVSAFANEPEKSDVIERNQIEVTTDANLEINPFYEPTKEDLIYNISVLQNNNGSYLELQKAISFEEYEEILANTEDTITFAEKGLIFEIDKQEFQNAVEKAIDSYNQSDKKLTERIQIGVIEGILAIGFVIGGGSVITCIVQEKREEKETKNQLVKERAYH